MSIERQQLVEQLHESRKYQRVCDQTLQRITDWALLRANSPKDALRRAKRKLHQVCGAFIDPKQLRAARSLIEQLPADVKLSETRDLCRQVLAQHASTRERLAVIDQMYDAISAAVGTPKRVLDIGCGLGPLASPWMDLAPAARYLAVDIDTELIEVVRAFFDRVPIRGEARCQDVLVKPPNEPTDLVFLLKTLPTLDQQEQGGGLRLLRALDFRCAAVSYPTRSIGGHRCGMGAHYSRSMEKLLETTGWAARTFTFETELLFVIRV